MKLIEKKPRYSWPSIFRDWLEENKTFIDNLPDSQENGNFLWEELGKTLSGGIDTTIDPTQLKNELQGSLYEEQGGICCYCGDRLGQYQSIEHFEPKSRRIELIFNYDNLLLCCKESRKSKKYIVGDTYNGILIESFANVAEICEIPEEKIRQYKSNRNLREPLQNRDRIHVPHPPHCDDEKSKYDDPKRQGQRVIINPTTDRKLINLLQFNSDGDISIDKNANEEQTKLIEDTRQVLGLDVETLKERRRLAWKDAENEYSDSLAELNTASLRSEQLRLIIQGLAEQANMRNEQGLFAKFCFVKAAYLRAIINV
jgi:5-methylcytosine-specific restriction endonuclease McrA